MQGKWGHYCQGHNAIQEDVDAEDIRELYWKLCSLNDASDASYQMHCPIEPFTR